jgi:hypothetical protein
MGNSNKKIQIIPSPVNNSNNLQVNDSIAGQISNQIALG